VSFRGGEAPDRGAVRNLPIGIGRVFTEVPEKTRHDAQPFAGHRPQQVFIGGVLGAGRVGVRDPQGRFLARGVPPPLGAILVVMLGMAVADRSGLLPAMLRAAVARVPARWLTFTLAFTAMVAHVASDAAYVVLVPLGATAFRAVGRSPMLGAVVAFVSVSAGYDASPLVTTDGRDPGRADDAAAHTVDPSYVVNPLSNHFFSVASSVLLALVDTVVTEKVIARRVTAMPEEPEPADTPEAADSTEAGGLTLRPEERRGLRNAGLALLAYFKWTGVGEVLAIRGAGLLKSAGVTGPVAFLGVLLVCTVINLLVTSGSAQWVLVSPVFVPMFMLLDIPPEVTQAVYRIADSYTNAATPMSPTSS
jgi:p-aminobenzoyl-glutamate transporter AbgT